MTRTHRPLTLKTSGSAPRYPSPNNSRLAACLEILLPRECLVCSRTLKGVVSMPMTAKKKPTVRKMAAKKPARKATKKKAAKKKSAAADS